MTRARAQGNGGEREVRTTIPKLREMGIRTNKGGNGSNIVPRAVVLVAWVAETGDEPRRVFHRPRRGVGDGGDDGHQPRTADAVDLGGEVPAGHVEGEEGCGEVGGSGGSGRGEQRHGEGAGERSRGGGGGAGAGPKR